MPATLQPLHVPREPSAVFQAILPGRGVVPLDAPDSPWQTFADPSASVAIGPDGMRLASAPGRRAWASPRLPLAPLGGSRPDQVEELTWDATITLDERFFVVCELRFAGEPGALLIQATPFDVQVFEDTERPNGGTSSSVSRLAGDGRMHAWRLRLDPSRLELRLDGATAWTLEGRRSLSRVAFGETRSDALHGGTMLLRDVVYVRRPA
ncbi:MAG: hypothetical protein HY332_02340 [Chloroflexi bacterium]|nr:hypothetical protein [Chloroflexota bacterium]